MQLNKLEKIITGSACRAQTNFESITDGWWLSYGPESFLQFEVARAIWRDDNWVFVDISVAKVQDHMERKRGRPASIANRRSDISVWDKAGKRLRAIIEIKHSDSISPVKKDADKVAHALTLVSGAKTGYLLVYSEAKGKSRRKVLKNRFRDWELLLNHRKRKQSWKLIAPIVRMPRDDEDEKWAWGIALFRLTIKKH